MSKPSAPPLRVLLINDGAHHVQQIQQELARQGCDVVGVIDQAPLIHDCVLLLKPDVVIVDSHSPSRDTLENLSALNDALPRPVVVLSADSSDEPMRRALEAGVSAYVAGGLQPQRLASVMQVAILRFEQHRALMQALNRSQARLASRRNIERAKGILMTGLALTEEAAYQRLRRMAMDRGTTVAEVAERVIEAHALLRPT